MKTEQQLDEALSRLSRDITPSRDLWPDIAGQLPARRQRHWQEWGAAAAALLLGFGLWSQWPSTDPASEQVVQHMPPALVTPASVTLTGLAQSQQQIVLAQQLVLQQLQQIPAGFDNWQQQLAIWQQASQQVELALQAEPDNSRLIRQLNQLQQQQLNYIRKLVHTSQLS